MACRIAADAFDQPGASSSTSLGTRERDEAFERGILEAAASAAPGPAQASPFAAQAEARLAMGERLYGDRWARTPLSALLNELLEEAADLGAWSVLALQSLDGLEVGAREAVEDAVLEAARAGARAHAAVYLALQRVPPEGRS